MRYVDRPTVECDVFIEADLTRVWEVVSDIELPAQFSPELRRVRWLDNVSPPTFKGHRTGLRRLWHDVGESGSAPAFGRDPMWMIMFPV